MSAVIVTTTPSIEGKTITSYRGIVTGEAIMGANIFKDLFAGIRDIVAAVGDHEKELRPARELRYLKCRTLRPSSAPTLCRHRHDYDTWLDRAIEGHRHGTQSLSITILPDLVSLRIVHCDRPPSLGDRRLEFLQQCHELAISNPHPTQGVTQLREYTGVDVGFRAFRRSLSKHSLVASARPQQQITCSNQLALASSQRLNVAIVVDAGLGRRRASRERSRSITLSSKPRWSRGRMPAGPASPRMRRCRGCGGGRTTGRSIASETGGSE